MDFTITPKITKDLLLSKFSEETIFCYYLGITNISKKLVRNVTRNDKKPTCGFYRNKSKTLILHDFATGEYFNCFSLVMKLYSCTYHKALKIIATDFGLISSEKPPVKVRHIPKFEQDDQITHIQIEMGEFTDQDLKWWKQFGITKKTLDKFRVFSCDTVFLNGNIFSKKAQHNPVYGYYFGKKEGIEQWRIYFPQRKEMRFIGNVPTKTIQGFKQLPKSGKLLVITKSMKDVMLLSELGIPAIAPNSETQFVSESVLSQLKSRFKHIVLLYDNDYTGVCFSNKIHKQYPELHVMLIPRSTKCKDISDYYKMYGKLKTMEFVKSGINYLVSKIK